MKKLLNIIDVKDILLLIGVLFAFYGIHSMHPPTAFIVLGGFFVFIGLPQDTESGGKV